MMTSATGRRAFTFIELLFVILIIGILVAVSIPNFRKTFNNLELNNFSRELQAVMNYLHQSAIVEGKAIYLNIDNEERQCLAQDKENAKKFKAFRIPDGINVVTEKTEIFFYPDGAIDAATIKISNANGQEIDLTTKGIFGGVKIATKE